MKNLSLHSRRGSYIAEAAIVLPVIILTILTVVLIIMFFYDESVNTSKMHIALRCETGQITEKTASYINESGVTDSGTIWDGTLTTSGQGFIKKVTANKSVSIIAKSVLNSREKAAITGSSHVIDSACYVRMHGSIK